MLDLYSEIEPYATGFLNVGDGHALYWEISGNPQGQPVVFLHGGPGSGTSPWQRRLFNPEKYKAILFDQRGAGKSTPHAALTQNTTAHLVADIEKLRAHLNIPHWAVFGGSWGSTLALAYADQHADKIDALVMYGIFLCRDAELRDLYCEGGIASRVFPDIFEPYIALLPPQDRHDPIAGYKTLFESPDEELRYRALDLWTRLEVRVSRLMRAKGELDAVMADRAMVLAHSLLENHYFINGGFIDGDRLLKEIGPKIAQIPTHIIQGRYDMVCPFITAWELHRAVPHSTLHIVENAGHTARAPEIYQVLIGVLNTLCMKDRKKTHEH